MQSSKLRSEDSDRLSNFFDPVEKSIADNSKSKETCCTPISNIHLSLSGYIPQNEETEKFYSQVHIPDNLKKYIFGTEVGSEFKKSNINKSIYFTQSAAAGPLKKSKINYLYNNPKYINPEKILLEDQSNSNFNDNWNIFNNISHVELQEVLDKDKSYFDDCQEFEQQNCANYCLVNNYETRQKGDQCNSNSIFTISCTINAKSDLNKRKSNYMIEHSQKIYGEDIWRRDYEIYYFQKPSNKENLGDQDSNIIYSSSSSNVSISFSVKSNNKSSNSGSGINSTNFNKPVVVNSTVLNKEQLGVNIFPKNISNENPENVKQETLKTNGIEISNKCPDNNNSLRKEYLYNINFLRRTKQLSESDLQSKSKESSTLLIGDKRNPFHTQLYVYPCQTSSDTDQKKNCKLTSQLSSTSKSKEMCDKKENTDWNHRLSVIFGCLNSKTRDVETVTMNSDSSCKKSFTNPNMKSRLIDSVPCSKNTDNVSTDVNKEGKTNDVAPDNTNTKSCKIVKSKISMKGDKIFITRVPCSCPKPKKKCDSPTPKCEAPLPKCAERPPKGDPIPKCETPTAICTPPTYEIPPPTFEDPPPSCNPPPPKTEEPAPKCSLKDKEKIKSIMKSHCEAMATIKCAMQDMVCKVFVASSEAASSAAIVIRSESAKQFEKIKNFELPKDDVTCPSPSNKIPCKRCQPKDCNNDSDLDMATILTRPINNSEDDDEEFIPLPKKIVDEIANKVGSAVMLIRENVDLTEFLKPRTLNDDSSKYDVPAKQFLMKNKPDNVSNLIHNGVSTSGNALFKNFTNRLLLMFSDREDKCTNGQSSLSSETSSDGEDIDDETSK